MRTYEAVFILDERHFEDAGEAFSQDVAKHIERLGGRLKERKALGRKQFSHPIKKKNAGVYWNFIFDMAPEQVATFENDYRLNETVLRTGVFLFDASN